MQHCAVLSLAPLKHLAGCTPAFGAGGLLRLACAGVHFWLKPLPCGSCPVQLRHWHEHTFCVCVCVHVDMLFARLFFGPQERVTRVVDPSWGGWPALWCMLD